MNPADPNSFSQTRFCVLTKLHLDWKIDFERKVVSGTATLWYDSKEPDNNVLVLDTNKLSIRRIYDQVSGQELQYKLHDKHLSFGERLDVTLAKSGVHSGAVCIQYETTSECQALQWLNAQQTAGKQQPYMFSQCQAIHARSLLPCQDTPLVKCPYTAQVEAPAPLVVLMSAIKDDTVTSTKTGRVHTFHQNVATPSYLIAIVCGQLESRDLSPRVRIWSEKEMVEESAREFEDTETMLKTGEELLGPYVWGRYDLLVLPPSFPYGGMENPCLTFLTPTLLAKDKSLANVVAHELAHSWTGNLVSNANWQHFWLNEGFTVFVERKILGRMFGEPHRHFAAINGWKSLEEEVERRGAADPCTKLVTNLEGVDPDDVYSCVPYEKGSSFLFCLEQKLGGADVFEPCFRDYLSKFQYKSITTDDWKSHLYGYFHQNDKKKILDEVDWDGWLNQPGLPPNKPEFNTELADICTELRKRWIHADVSCLDEFTPDDVTAFSSNQMTEFLSQLLQEKPLPAAKLLKMDSVYELSKKINCEIRFRWIRLCLKARYESVLDLALEMLNSQGRMKYSRPIYRDLYAWDKTKETAVENFKTHRDNMHAISAAMIAKDLELST